MTVYDPSNEVETQDFNYAHLGILLMDMVYIGLLLL